MVRSSLARRAGSRASPGVVQNAHLSVARSAGIAEGSGGRDDSRHCDAHSFCAICAIGISRTGVMGQTVKRSTGRKFTSFQTCSILSPDSMFRLQPHGPSGLLSMSPDDQARYFFRHSAIEGGQRAGMASAVDFGGSGRDGSSTGELEFSSGFLAESLGRSTAASCRSVGRGSSGDFASAPARPG